MVYSAKLELVYSVGVEYVDLEHVYAPSVLIYAQLEYT